MLLRVDVSDRQMDNGPLRISGNKKAGIRRLRTERSPTRCATTPIRLMQMAL